MSDFLSPILQWINAHPHLAGLVTFIISAAESVAIIGTIVPGSVMMTAIGTLAGAGVMPLWTTIFWAILGAIVGDGVSYWLGYYFKDRIRSAWPFKTHPYLLDSGEKFFHKYGGMSVFIGRFVGPVRALVPLVAGMLRMKPLRFTVANVTSAILWAPAYMLPGIALGAASLELPPDIAAHALLVFLLVTLFIILVIWSLKQLFLLIHTQVDAALTKLWHKLYLSRFSPVTVLLHHHNPTKTYGQLTRAFYFLVFLLVFISLSCLIYYYGSQNLFLNNLFFYVFRSLRTPLGDDIMLTITLLGEVRILFPVFIALFIWFAWQKRWHTAWHVLILGIATTLSIELFKNLIHSGRPWGIYLAPSGMSYPSGHTTMSIVFYLGAAILLIQALNKQYRYLIYTFAWLIILAICISRIYLGAHWFTDVIGGLLLGTCLLILFTLSFNRRAEKKPSSASGMMIVILLSLTLSYSVFAIRNYSIFKHNYAQIDWPIQTISIESWWNQSGENVPRYRLNRIGLSTQLLNIQWLGNLDRIHGLLLQNGWQIPPARDWIGILHRISDVQSSEHLPLVSPLYLDKEPVLVLTKSIGNKLIVLRLWNPNLLVKNINLPMWVGTVESSPRTYSWLFNRKKYNDLNLNPSLLFKKTPDNYDIKVVTIKTSHRRSDQQSVVLIKPSNL